VKIAVPTHHGRFSEHFGGADAFALYSVDEGSRTLGEPTMGSPPEHGRGVFPMWLRQQGTTVILAGGMGPRAAGIFAQHGIEVVTGIRGDDPDTVVRAYLDGTLVASGEVCHEQNYHDCGHDHGHGGRGGCHNR
jgi:ATP-binding protein involved in chromosome partitioning